MTRSTPERAPFTKKAIDVLNADPVFAKKPIAAGAIPRVGADLHLAAPPYGIVWPLWTNKVGGTWRQPEADVEWIYQLSMYSTMFDQLEIMRDAAIRLWTGRDASGAWTTNLDAPGVKVWGRRIADDAGGEDLQPAGDLQSLVLRFGFAVSVADT